MDVGKVLGSLSSLGNIANVHTDNAVFQLHYRFTVVMLLLFSILITTKQYFGDPIDCDTSGTTGVHKDVVETFCWIYGTYTLKGSTGDPKTPGLGNEVGREKNWHLYYQWVTVVLLLQALFFYIPFYLWRIWEGGRMAKLVEHLDGPLVPAEWTESTKQRLVDYIINYKYLHTLYAFRYALCEVLNFFNVVIQVFFINWVFNGQYSTFGLSILNFEGLGENPFMALFPKTTKCKYHNYGPSGSVQDHDFLCVLALNVLNEKLFLILWFWMIFLVIVSFLMVVYRLVLIVCPKVRVYILLVQVRHFSLQHMRKIVDSVNYGGFFLLYGIGKNVHPLVYGEIVSSVYEAVKNEHGLKPRNQDNVIVV